MSSSKAKIDGKNKNNQIKELLENQTHILNAVQNLNERLLAIEEKVDDGKLSGIPMI